VLFSYHLLYIHFVGLISIFAITHFEHISIHIFNTSGNLLLDNCQLLLLQLIIFLLLGICHYLLPVVLLTLIAQRVKDWKPFRCLFSLFQTHRLLRGKNTPKLSLDHHHFFKGIVIYGFAFPVIFLTHVRSTWSKASGCCAQLIDNALPRSLEIFIFKVEELELLSDAFFPGHVVEDGSLANGFEDYTQVVWTPLASLNLLFVSLASGRLRAIMAATLALLGLAHRLAAI